MKVGVRELRNNLSVYLARVRGGEELVVTDRGHAVARLLPADTERLLDRLVTEGVVTAARRPERRAVEPVRSDGTVSDLVPDQRR